MSSSSSGLHEAAARHVIPSRTRCRKNHIEDGQGAVLEGDRPAYFDCSFSQY